MRTFVPENVLQQIVDSTLHIYGKEIITPSECKLLAQSIFTKTHKTISETTLKRVFGFAKRDFHFSIYTLEALALYSGYEAWDAFYLKALPEIMENEKDSAWQKLKKISKVYSLGMMHATAHSAGAASGLIGREDFTGLITTFISSNKTIAPVIAPTGFSKSISLFQTASNLWLGENPLFPDDICCFINVQKLLSIAFNHNSLSEWLMQYPKAEKINSFDAARAAGHRLIFIIDGIDDASISYDKQKIVFANITEFANLTAGYGYVKIILGMRPHSWKKLKAFIGNTAFFNEQVFTNTSYWVEEYVSPGLVFSFQEITVLLNKYGVSDDTVSNLSEKFKHFLSYPEHMRIFCNGRYVNSLKTDLEEVIMYEVTSTFIKNHFNFGNGVLKYIIENIIQAKLSSSTGSIYENDINVNYPSGINYYIQLFDNNILQEESFYSEDIFSFPKIKFASSMIEEYFIAYYCLAENNQDVDKKLIAFIFGLHLPRKNKMGILRWIIIDMIHSEKTSGLDSIFEYTDITELERLSFFEFILSFNNEKKLTPEILTNICEKYELTRLFIAQKDLIFYFAQRETFILQLLDLTKHGCERKALLQILFTRCLSELRLNDAATYLKYYRIEEKNNKHLFSDMSQKIMNMALDFSRYDTKSENAADLVAMFIKSIEAEDVIAYASMYCSFLLLIHYLVFTGNYKLLAESTVEVLNLISEDEAAITFITLLGLLNKYAKICTYEKQKASALHPVATFDLDDDEDTFINDWQHFIQARYSLNERENSRPGDPDKNSFNISDNNKLKIHVRLSYFMLKKMYISENRSNVATMTDIHIKTLLAKFLNIGTRLMDRLKNTG